MSKVRISTNEGKNEKHFPKRVATSKTQTRTPDPGPGPRKTWTLKNVVPEKHGKRLDMKK